MMKHALGCRGLHLKLAVDGFKCDDPKSLVAWFWLDLDRRLARLPSLACTRAPIRPSS